ncbi:aspartate 1-decarboxylase [Roseiconus nitratireducens]|uniref:Aspartate 1-decarboxylase n=1 Tax=Roseiconus nitratireducens TaxID=2605748 RepID=A0A5M6CXU7_9BACT|nr:aspartate 1-decarboxylase [Roseiconus nitratireducens]KAA5540048.1 aspartate 1-decarboxylase [Roseiconus nitratireducens]
MTGPLRKVLSAKIHRATISEANVDYEGSITIPPELLQAADIAPYESVCVWNVTRGTRLETYAISGLPGSNDVCANGAAAHLIQPGDRVIIAAYAFMTTEQLKQHRPRLIFVDEQNRITHSGPEVPGPQRRSDPGSISGSDGDRSTSPPPSGAGTSPKLPPASDLTDDSSRRQFT